MIAGYLRALTFTLTGRRHAPRAGYRAAPPLGAPVECVVGRHFACLDLAAIANSCIVRAVSSVKYVLRSR